MHTVGADHPAVVMKVRNGTGAKGMGQLAESDLPTMRMGGASFSLCRLDAVRHQEKGWQEPYELRGSRTVLGGTGGESPPVYSTSKFCGAIRTEDFSVCPGKAGIFSRG
ncbi:MAG: hypothetical protein GTO12_08775 [Proteobacteria bacterium]|nr:hypothetical protein [Pseudomonadota bacterium]